MTEYDPEWMCGGNTDNIISIRDSNLDNNMFDDEKGHKSFSKRFSQLDPI